jgi:hypothetical protein
MSVREESIIILMPDLFLRTFTVSYPFLVKAVKAAKLEL